MDFDGIRDGEKLGEADGKETIIRIHCIKIEFIVYFQKDKTVSI